MRTCASGYPVTAAFAYLAGLAEIPVTAGGKADRKSLPPPSGQRAVEPASSDVRR